MAASKAELCAVRAESAALQARVRRVERLEAELSTQRDDNLELRKQVRARRGFGVVTRGGEACDMVSEVAQLSLTLAVLRPRQLQALELRASEHGVALQHTATAEQDVAEMRGQLAAAQRKVCVCVCARTRQDGM